jgi:hypothetical protein
VDTTQYTLSSYGGGWHYSARWHWAHDW